RAHFLEDSVGLADKSVHETFLNIYTEDRVYDPFSITYSFSGWTINGQFVPGFTDGLSKTFNQMKIGGRSLIVMPSILGYGTSPRGALIPANSVLVFELRPTAITKQQP
ncbi:MAG: FKBP-type peptidyl-prolyl cis-trans isomerase, partial [Bacteroidota bacterium]